MSDNDVFRDLENPATVAQALFEQVELAGRDTEVVYLDSNLVVSKITNGVESSIPRVVHQIRRD